MNKLFLCPVMAFLAVAILLDGCGGAGPTTPPPVVAMAPPPAAVLPPAVASQFYYVAPAGSDNDPGTLTRPWKTVQKALNNVPAGATILVRAGVYSERPTMIRSGSPTDGYISLQNYPNEVPVIDGSAFSGSTAADGLINLTDVSYVRVQGFELRNLVSNSAGAVPIGIYVTGAGSHIELRNNLIHDIRTTVNDATGNAFGIAVYGTRASASLSDIIIDGNELTALQTGSSESMALNGNVERFSVTGNRVHDNNNIGIALIGFEGKAADVAVDQARDGVVSGNLVYNISSYGNPAYGVERSAGGIYVDGGTRIIIERNQVHHVDLGIEIASEHAGRTSSLVTVRSNLIMLNNLSGISLGGASAANGGTDSCGIFNNTLFHNDVLGTSSGEIQFQNHVVNNQIANNLIVAGTSALLISAAVTQTGSAAQIDDNLYFSAGPAAQASWVWNGVTTTGFAAYVQASGNDSRSRFADPLLINSDAGNFNVAVASPAVDAGRALTLAQAGTFDYAGAARVQGAAIDIGAYER